MSRKKVEYVDVPIRLGAELTALVERMAKASGLTNDQMASAMFALACRADPPKKPIEPPGRKPIGWVTGESLSRLQAGGNGSRGSVPIHAKRSSVARFPLYALPSPPVGA